YRTGTWGTRAVLQFRGEGLGEMGTEPRYPDWVGAGATGTWGTQKRSFGGGSEGHEGEGGGLDPAGGAGSPTPAAEFVVMLGVFAGLKMIQEFLPAAGIARVVVAEPLQGGVDGFFVGGTLRDKR